MRNLSTNRAREKASYRFYGAQGIVLETADGTRLTPRLEKMSESPGSDVPIIVEPGKSRGRGEGGGDRSADVWKLIELARRPEGEEWTAERRERVYQRVLARVEEERERRRVRRVFAAGVCGVLLVGLVLRLIAA